MNQVLIKKKQKKDKLFVIVLAVTSAGILYQTLMQIVNVYSRNLWGSLFVWVILICNMLAFYAIMYLLHNYRLKMKANQITQEQRIKIIEETLLDFANNKDDYNSEGTAKSLLEKLSIKND